MGAEIVSGGGMEHQPNQSSSNQSSSADSDQSATKLKEYEERVAKLEGEYSRMGQIQAFLDDEGNRDKFPLLRMMGQPGVNYLANALANEEESSGVPPNMMDTLARQEKIADQHNRDSIKLWSQNKLTAQRMVDALQEQGYSIHAVGPRLTLMNEDSHDAGSEVDTSKLSGDELIRYNMELAERRSAASKK